MKVVCKISVLLDGHGIENAKKFVGEEGWNTLAKLLLCSLKGLSLDALKCIERGKEI